MVSASAPGDDRDIAEVHLAYKIILFFAALTLGGLSWIVLNRPFRMMMDQAAAHTSGETAAEGQMYLIQVWDALPVVFAVLFAFGLVIASQQEAERP